MVHADQCPLWVTSGHFAQSPTDVRSTSEADTFSTIAMSALGQKQTFKRLRLMSALPPKADMDQCGCDVRFVPKADISAKRT